MSNSGDSKYWADLLATLSDSKRKSRSLYDSLFSFGLSDSSATSSQAYLATLSDAQRKPDPFYGSPLGFGAGGAPVTSGLEALASLGLAFPTVELAPKSLTPLNSLKDDLNTEVQNIFQKQWETRDGNKVPEVSDLALGNEAVLLDGTVLYADLSDSTKLVDSYKPHFAAEVYKTYLACAARIVKAEAGVITAYDGDRIMGVFIGDTKNTRAVRAALRINGAVWDIIKPALKAQYPTNEYNLKHVIGVDTSKLFVSRIGVRKDNDLVWVGRAANYAAKLSSLNDYAVYITDSVHDVLHDSVKHFNSQDFWSALSWTSMGGMRIYGSRWRFPV